MKFKTKEDILNAGFKGLIEFGNLCATKEIPTLPGVYMVLLLPSGQANPRFDEQGIYKDKNPNVSLKELNDKWVSDTCVLYIGKTITPLRKRIRAYRNFGYKQSRGHSGGRYIWHIKGNKKFLMCWKECKNPRTKEKELLTEFQSKYLKLPFANCKL